MRIMLKLARATALLAATVSIGATQAAEDPPTPTTLKGGKIVSVAEAKGLLDSKAATFIDPRSALNYGKGRVPGAVLVAYKGKSDNVPNFDASQDSFPIDKLPKDKATPVVFYGHGDNGWKAYKASVLAINAGYSKVHYMRSGFQSWEQAGLPIER